ncbi:MAG: hypothetical protein ACFFD4_00865 [Candidatus Odinarchaeota archaeon]
MKKRMLSNRAIFLGIITILGISLVSSVQPANTASVTLTKAKVQLVSVVVPTGDKFDGSAGDVGFYFQVHWKRNYGDYGGSYTQDEDYEDKVHEPGEYQNYEDNLDVWTEYSSGVTITNYAEGTWTPTNIYSEFVYGKEYYSGKPQIGILAKVTWSYYNWIFLIHTWSGAYYNELNVYDHYETSINVYCAGGHAQFNFKVHLS